MTPMRIVPVRYGQEASAVLAGVVADTKRDDPLSPVTVIVPSNTIGVFSRRRLAGDQGVIAVNFLTVYRLAELLGAPALAAAARRPVSSPVVVAALGRALRNDPGSFAAVVDHPSTAEALFERYRELSKLSPAAFAAFAQTASPRVRDIGRVVAAARDRLRGSWYDESDLLRAATDAVESGHAWVDTLGQMIVHLPQELSVPAGHLLSAVALRVPTVVVAGFTGQARADDGVRRSLTRLGADEVAPREHAPPPPTVTTASDPDAEVRAAIAHVLEAARSDIPFDSIALLYPADRPYRRLVADHLNAARIPWNGPETTPLSERIIGRTIRLLLLLTERRFHRSAVFELLSSVPVLDASGRPVPAARWERISREAGVVSDIVQWRFRLTHYADGEERTAEALAADPDNEARASRSRRRAGEARELLTFVSYLAHRLEQADRLTSWSGFSIWARESVQRLVGGEHVRLQWPEEEQRAAERVDEILDRLAALDSIDPDARLASFTRALQRELDDDLGRVGSFGEGVLVGPLGAALGLELELVVILGAAEGTLPSGNVDDALIPDDDREKAGGELEPSRARLDRQYRHFLAAMAASKRAPVLFAPRGDLRRPTHQPLSRWVPGAASIDLASFASWAASPSIAPTAQIARLRALSNTPGSLADLGRRDVAVQRGLALINARRSAAFTVYDGNLGGVPNRPQLQGTTTSATRLEAWVRCPFNYFVTHVLGVQPVDDPEDHFTMEPTDSGSLMHATLEEFMVRVGSALPEPDDAWDDPARQMLHAAFADHAADYEARGLTGRALLWARDQRDLAADLDEFLRDDAAHRAQYRTRRVFGELRFGMHEPFTVSLPDGRSLSLRGSIDRVDQTDAGAVVIDYKTGKDTKYRKLSAVDPLAGGTVLQLPIYALAARDALEIAGAIDAYYWFISRNKGGDRRGYTVDDDVVSALTNALGLIVSSIEAGIFVPRPGAPVYRVFNDCLSCDPDSLGTAEAYRLWRAKRSAPELAAYVDYIGADDD